MMTLAIISTLVGVAFGLRFQLFVLASLVWVSVALIIAAGISNQESAWSILTFSVAIASLFQIGYLGGSLTRFAIDSTSKARFRVAVSRSGFGGPAK